MKDTGCRQSGESIMKQQGLKRRIYKTEIMKLLTLFPQKPWISLLPTQWDSKLLQSIIVLNFEKKMRK